MTQASGDCKQCIAEGYKACRTSRDDGLRLFGEARDRLEELLACFHDLAHGLGIEVWGKNDSRMKSIRAMVRMPKRTYRTYAYLFERSAIDYAVNGLICLVHQIRFALGRKLSELYEQRHEERLMSKESQMDQEEAAEADGNEPEAEPRLGHA